MQRTSAILLISLLSCGGGSFYGTMPLGWRGSIPSCDAEEIVGGAALRKQPTGGLEAVAAGRSTLRCKGNDSTTDVGVKPIARLVIDGPATIAAGARPSYELHAFADDGEELAFGYIDEEPSEHVITWATTSGTIEPPARSDMLPSPEPSIDRVRLDPASTAVAGTTITITATFATSTTKLTIAVH